MPDVHARISDYTVESVYLSLGVIAAEGHVRVDVVAALSRTEGGYNHAV